MSSFFDAMFRGASPHLMNTMGTRRSVTIMLGSQVLARAIDAVLRHEGTEDEVDEDGYVFKRYRSEIEILRNPNSSYGGLEEAYTNATVTMNGIEWEIDNYANLSATWARIGLVRVVPRAGNLPGRYRGT